ncbi:hypothetical protein BG000_000665 [Podila horticola]|nr:hypothetical protein BG000_000665 [Podila horticola]
MFNVRLVILALLFTVIVHAQWTAQIEGKLCKRDGTGCLNECDFVEDILYDNVLRRIGAQGTVLCQRWSDHARIIFLLTGRRGNFKWKYSDTKDPELKAETGGQIVNACSVSGLCDYAINDYKFFDTNFMPAAFYCIKGTHLDVLRGWE